MITITNLSEFKKIAPNGLAVCIGNFDGLHSGHRKLLKNLQVEAKSRNLKTCLITLKPHPKLFLQKQTYNFLINTYSEKIDLLENFKLNYLYELCFDEELQMTSARDFIKKFFVEPGVVQLLYLGHDFALGMGKESALEILSEEAPSIEVLREEKVEIDNKVCSSSLIRDELIHGHVEIVNKMLEREFFITGTVISGLGIGSKDLVPTANIKWDNVRIIPRDGVYFSETLVDTKWYYSLTNIGHSPTVVENGEKRIETFLLNYNENIYSKEIKIKFLKYHREEKSFASRHELLTQIKNDIEARKVF